MTDTPGLAYHYTSAEAFLSIINSGCLRASSTHVLNDRSETVYGLEQFRDYTAGGHGGEGADYLMAVLNDEDSLIESNEYNDIFVVSASRLHDSTSQWYAYGDGGRGYAIGFRADAPLALRTDIPPRRELSLEMPAGDFSTVETWQRVHYGWAGLHERFHALTEAARTLRDRAARKRENLFANAGSTVEEQMDAASEAFFEEQMAAANIAGEANRLFRLLKDKPWQEEEELRSVVVLRDAPHLVKYKPARNGGIAPYVELITQLAGSESPLRYLPEPNEHPGHLPIAEVIVGPLAGPRDKGFVEDLLKQHKYEDVNVRRSLAAMG